MEKINAIQNLRLLPNYGAVPMIAYNEANCAPNRSHTAPSSKVLGCEKSSHTLSIILIVKNEARCIKRCLDSVAWANEIIILDSGSTDDTVKICKTYTEKVYQTDWPGFGIQKNRALKKATGEWILSIDADEWVSDELKEEIKQIITHSTHTLFSIPRRTQYLGEWLYHGDIGKDRVVRLFKRGIVKFTDDVVHESIETSGQYVGRIKSFLFHDSYESVETLLSRMNQYTTLSAKMRYDRGKTASLKKAITHGIWAFLKSYVFRAGFLDGRIGFIAAVSSAESSYYRYVKLIYFKKNRVAERGD
ncbi:MAG: glycosyltransferase family 2 protein [Gammaproteobacteria bacterium]|nr:glycosyltransferase family 2 protein [Gammaproteobacteria bacterium]